MSQVNFTKFFFSMSFKPSSVLIKYEPRASTLHKFPFALFLSVHRSYTLAYLFRKRSIYIDAVNWNINMFMQSGLTVKWERETTQYFKLEADRKHRRVVKDAKVKINLRHLQTAFVGLFLGSILSLLVFLGEKRCFRRFSTRRLLTKTNEKEIFQLTSRRRNLT